MSMNIHPIPDNIPISGYSNDKGTPSIMILRTSSMYQRAGIRLDRNCKTGGMLSMVKIIPDSRMVGIISSIPEMSSATTCFSVTQEINNPNVSETRIKSNETASRPSKLPAIGTWSTKRDKSKIVVRLMIESRK